MKYEVAGFIYFLSCVVAVIIYGITGHLEYVENGWDCVAEILFWPLFFVIRTGRAFVRRIGAAFQD